MAKIIHAGATLDPQALRKELLGLQDQIAEVLLGALRDKLRDYIDRVNQRSFNKRQRLIELGADPNKIPKGQNVNAPLRGRRGASVRIKKQAKGRTLIFVESKIFAALDTGRKAFIHSKDMFFFAYERDANQTKPDSLEVQKAPAFVSPLQLLRISPDNPEVQGIKSTKPRSIMRAIIKEIEAEVRKGKYSVTTPSGVRVKIKPDDFWLAVR